jgi:glycerol-3-phosphate acyltransferase PlsY
MSIVFYFCAMPVTVYLLPIAAYLLGAIPTAVWLSKYIYGKDVREHGSKNAGATNTFRVLGKQAGIMVLIADILKGTLAASLSLMVAEQFNADDLMLYKLALGFTATMGHIYSIFIRFKGGKGVATFTGMLYFIFPLAAITCTAFFLIVFIFSHYISLSSMSSALLFPLAAILFYQLDDMRVMLLLGLIPLIVLYTHRSNMLRLARGEESKMYLYKRKSG